MDFPEVITERKKFYAETAHYRMLSGNAADPMWLTQIPAGEAAVIVMEGVSMYLAPKELAGLFEMLGRAVSLFVPFLMECVYGGLRKSDQIQKPHSRSWGNKDL